VRASRVAAIDGSYGHRALTRLGLSAADARHRDSGEGKR
jgi:hypothetical protein